MVRKKTKKVSKGYQANDIIKRKPKKQSYSKKGPKRNRWSPKTPVVAVIQKGPKSRTGLLPGTIDYKNVVLLRKLINIEGKILPRRINHLTGKQQRYTARAIKSSRLMGLLPFIHKNRPLIQQKKLKKRTTTFAKKLNFSKKSSLAD
jgi:ribosomal protein S18